MKQSTPIRLRALNLLRFNKLRQKGDEFEVPNESWVKFFTDKGLAERVAAVQFRPVKEQTEAVKKPKGGERRAVETDRGISVTRGDMAAPLLG